MDLKTLILNYEPEDSDIVFIKSQKSKNLLWYLLGIFLVFVIGIGTYLLADSGLFQGSIQQIDKEELLAKTMTIYSTETQEQVDIVFTNEEYIFEVKKGPVEVWVDDPRVGQLTLVSQASPSFQENLKQTNIKKTTTTEMGYEEGKADINADFDYEAAYLGEMVRVKFTNLSEGNIEEFEWTFENGQPDSSTERTPPIIEFFEQGSYLITLTARYGKTVDQVQKEIELREDQITPAVGGAMDRSRLNVLDASAAEPIDLIKAETGERILFQVGNISGEGLIHIRIGNIVIDLPIYASPEEDQDGREEQVEEVSNQPKNIDFDELYITQDKPETCDGALILIQKQEDNGILQNVSYDQKTFVAGEENQLIDINEFAIKNFAAPNKGTFNKSEGIYRGRSEEDWIFMELMDKEENTLYSFYCITNTAPEIEEEKEICTNEPSDTRLFDRIVTALKEKNTESFQAFLTMIYSDPEILNMNGKALEETETIDQLCQVTGNILLEYQNICDIKQKFNHINENIVDQKQIIDLESYRILEIMEGEISGSVENGAYIVEKSGQDWILVRLLNIETEEETTNLFCMNSEI